MVQPVLQSVVPYRLRGMGSALGSIYIFFIGATGGALLSASAHRRVRLAHRGDRDHGSVDDHRRVPDPARRELHPQRPLAGRRRAAGGDGRASAPAGVTDGDPRPCRSPTSTSPTARCRCSSTSASRSRRGEVLALLGTNGAGKSTILRVIAGLGTPGRGVVRLNGRTITYTAPEQRAKLGIRILLGGKGVFPAMTVHENLGDGGVRLPGRRRRLPTSPRPRVLELFPALADRRRRRRRSCRVVSSRCSRWRWCCSTTRRCSLIDELSLGLAPLVVQELLA